MGKWGSVNFSDLKKLQKSLEKTQKEIPLLMKEVATEIGNEFLQGVISRTPSTDDNKLKNAWKLTVNQKGNNFEILLENPLEYASMIEYGHKTAIGGFKQGVYMLKITEQEIVNKMDTIASRKLNKYLQGIF